MRWFVVALALAQVAALMFGADDAAVPAVRADQGIATDDSQHYPAAMRLAEVEAQVAAEQTAQVEARVEAGVEVGAGAGAGVQMQAQVGGGKKMFQLGDALAYSDIKKPPEWMLRSKMQPPGLPQTRPPPPVMMLPPESV